MKLKLSFILTTFKLYLVTWEKSELERADNLQMEICIMLQGCFYDEEY